MPVHSEGATSTTITRDHIHLSQLLSSQPGLIHGITRRVKGAGKADGNVGYSAPRDREDAWIMRQQWMASAELEASSIVVAYQTHGADAIVVAESDAGRGADPESKPVGHADALIVHEPGVVAMTLHADCMPVLLHDPVNRVAATIHAGWRGTVADVVGATVRAMTAQFNSEPATILAYLGPAIGGCCYEVGEDVEAEWSTHGLAVGLVTSGDRWRFDLAVANRELLLRAGLQESAIEESRICTRCSGEEWFSHRGQGANTGRYGSFVALTE